MARFLRHLAWVCLVSASHANAHNWYSGNTDPVFHLKCCGDHDCHPINSSDVRSALEGYYVRQPQPYSRNDPPTGEWFVPWDRVQSASDDKYHICEKSPSDVPHWPIADAMDMLFPRATGSISG